MLRPDDVVGGKGRESGNTTVRFLEKRLKRFSYSDTKQLHDNYNYGLTIPPSSAAAIAARTFEYLKPVACSKQVPEQVPEQVRGQVPEQVLEAQTLKEALIPMTV